MSQVELILIESIHSLGEAGDLVRVKPGFARNYLLPEGKAILATRGKVQELEHIKRIAEEKAARELNDLQAVKKQLEALSIEVGARAGEGGKLFGSVTAQQIAEKINAAGLEVDRRRLDLGQPIKEVGEHVVKVKLLRELTAELTVKVVSEGGPSPEDEREEFEEREAREKQRREEAREREEREEDDAPE